MRTFLLLLCVVLPNPLKLAIYRALGFRIGKNVRIGMSLFLNIVHVEIGDNCRIGHFNQFRSLTRFELGKSVLILNFNEVTGYYGAPHWPSSFVAEDSVMIMSRHFFDCTGTIRIKTKALIGGRDTQLWTHARAILDDGSLELLPYTVEVGRDAYIGARCTLVACSVPDGATVAAASVVVKNHLPEPCRVLLAGNPAVVKKRYENHPVPAPSDAKPAIQ